MNMTHTKLRESNSLAPHYALLLGKTLVRTSVRLSALLLLGFFLFALSPLGAHAATINVDGTTCKLPDAIRAAETESAAGGCDPGSGDDILLLAPITHVLTTTLSNLAGPTGTPAINSTITISGGVSGATIERTGSEAYRLFYISSNGDLTLDHVTLRNGLADPASESNDAGGAVWNTHNLTIRDSTVISNHADAGGAIDNFVNGTLTVINSTIISNSARVGGGIYTIGGTTLIDTSRILSNTSTSSGGGLSNDNSDTVTVTNSQIAWNQSFLGGGINSNYATTTIDNSQVTTNSASSDGGGIFAVGSTVIVNGTQIDANQAGTDGGGISNSFDTAFTLTNSTLRANVAAFDGGAVWNSTVMTVTSTDVSDNSAGSTGGAFFQDSAVGSKTMVHQSCIVNNSDIAVANTNSNSIDAKNNWWGTANGPGGAGPGQGNSISTGVTFAPILNSAPGICAGSQQALFLAAKSSPKGALLPGQPLTFTVVITNAGDKAIQNLELAEIFSEHFLLGHLTPSNQFIDDGENGGVKFYALATLDAHKVITQSFVGWVDKAITQGDTITHTSKLSTDFPHHLEAATSNNVSIPTVAWSAATYSTSEDAGDFTAHVNLSSANPYTTTTVEATISEHSPQEVTFPPNSVQQPLVIEVVNDTEINPDQVIDLALQSPSGAKLGPLNSAQLTIHEDDTNTPPPPHELKLAVSKQANVSAAHVGDTITYTYKITNTGNTALVIDALDNKVGVLSKLNQGGPLAVNGKRTETKQHVVTSDDLTHEPLVNTVTVTGTDSLNAQITVSDTVSVHILPSEPAGNDKPEFKLKLDSAPSEAQAGDTITLTYKISNTGDVTITSVTTEVVALDAVPAEFVDASFAPVSVAGPALTIEVPPGAETLLSIPFEIPATLPPGTLGVTFKITVTAGNGQSTSQTTNVTIQLQPLELALPYLSHK